MLEQEVLAVDFLAIHALASSPIIKLLITRSPRSGVQRLEERACFTFDGYIACENNFESLRPERWVVRRRVMEVFLLSALVMFQVSR